MLRDERVMKSKFYYLLPLLSFYLLSSCTQDAYDKGEGELSRLLAEMGDGYTSADKKVTYFVTDDGTRHTVVNPFTSNLMPKADTIYRAVFYYVDNGTDVQVNGLNRVLVITPHQTDSIKAEAKTDPVKFESLWMGKNKKYLNLSLYLKLGTAEDEEAVQKVACSLDSLHHNADGTHTACLTFLHDQAGVPQYYSQRVYFSIPLQQLRADSVSLSINTWQGLVTKRLKL